MLIAAGIVLVLFAALLAAPGLIPADVYRSPIQTNASLALGREVRLTGPMSVRLIPRIEVRAKGARIANPSDFEGSSDPAAPAFAEMEELRAAVGIWPLLFGETRVDELILVKPRLNLIRLADGRNNWTFNLPPPRSDEASAWIGRLDIIEGEAAFEDKATGVRRTLTALNLQARMPSPDTPLVVEMSATGTTIKAGARARLESPRSLLEGGRSPLSVDLEGEALTGRIEGDIGLGETPGIDVAIDAQAASLSALLEEAGITLASGREALGSFEASGRMFGPFDDLAFKIETARVESPVLDATISGDLRLGGGGAMMLRADARSSDPAGLAKAFGVPGPPAGDQGETRLSGRLVGQAGALGVQEMTLSHKGRMISATYKGEARLAETLSHTGTVEVAIPSLRDLAGAAGLPLPAGDIFKELTLTGAMSGSGVKGELKGLVLSLDGIEGRGDLALESAERLRLSGRLATSIVTLSPYIASSLGKGRGADAGGWSQTPIQTDFLKAFDLDLAIRSEGLVHDGFIFGPSDLALRLEGGELTADLSNTTLFGGKGGALLRLDARAPVAAARLTARLSGLSLKPFLAAAARFERIEGSGDIEVDLSGQGETLAAAMSSLSGKGQFRFENGALRGLDLVGISRLGRSKNPAPGGLIGENARTKFDSLQGRFEASSGVARTQDLRLTAEGISVTGQGQLDIGGRRVDLSLFSELKASGVKVPVRVRGEWSRVRVSIDTGEILRQAAGEVRGRIERSAGRPPASPPVSAPAPEPAPAAPPTTPPSRTDRLKRELDRLFSGSGDPG